VVVASGSAPAIIATRLAPGWRRRLTGVAGRGSRRGGSAWLRRWPTCGSGLAAMPAAAAAAAGCIASGGARSGVSTVARISTVTVSRLVGCGAVGLERSVVRGHGAPTCGSPRNWAISASIASCGFALWMATAVCHDRIAWAREPARRAVSVWPSVAAA